VNRSLPVVYNVEFVPVAAGVTAEPTQMGVYCWFGVGVDRTARKGWTVPLVFAA